MDYLGIDEEELNTRAVVVETTVSTDGVIISDQQYGSYQIKIIENLQVIQHFTINKSISDIGSFTMFNSDVTITWDWSTKLIIRTTTGKRNLKIIVY